MRSKYRNYFKVLRPQKIKASSETLLPELGAFTTIACRHPAVPACTKIMLISIRGKNTKKEVNKPTTI